MRVLGLLGWSLVVVLVSAWLAVVEVMWLPLRVGGVAVPLSVVGAIAGNLLLVAAARWLSGSRAVAVLPAVVWLVVAVAGAMRRPEGDLLITGGDGATQAVNLAFLLLGVVAAAFAVGRVLGEPGRRTVSRAGAGSGNGGAR
ncbi:hypothetical protein SAMN05661080_01242 [Modestobacter sp. DSM 44400]|uniref:hypothetical protein n=1 Tax=Modestobacter sp. DSM 44400 TaxID=1550230 RepID=UPI000894A30D|nr:hypothetical protein [Modestobacter sp. DSM 44400]SDX79601.1 hypothetical protein SAMN05661080_01242 [Modestobacter sp. DSM 44400]